MSIRILSIALSFAWCGASHGQSAGPAPAPPDYSQYEARKHIGTEGRPLLYRLVIPRDYAPGKSLPLIVWLHGSGEKGNNNTSQLPGIAKTFLADPGTPSFIMIPQCPNDTAWHAVGLNEAPPITETARMIVATIQQLVREFKIDDRRIYLGGFSMGGCGTWEILGRYPNLFAAGFPIAGPAGERYALARFIKDIPIWVFHGEKDNVAPVDLEREMVAALKAAGSKVIYTEYPGVGHEAARALAEPKLLEWLFAQTRTATPVYTPSHLPDEALLITRTIPDGTHGTWTGKMTANRKGDGRIFIGKVGYWTEIADRADSSVADFLEKVGRREIAGECQVTGTIRVDGQASIWVEKISLVTP